MKICLEEAFLNARTRPALLPFVSTDYYAVGPSWMVDVGPRYYRDRENAESEHSIAHLTAGDVCAGSPCVSAGLETPILHRIPSADPALSRVRALRSYGAWPRHYFVYGAESLAKQHATRSATAKARPQHFVYQLQYIYRYPSYFRLHLAAALPSTLITRVAQCKPAAGPAIGPPFRSLVAYNERALLIDPLCNRANAFLPHTPGSGVASPSLSDLSTGSLGSSPSPSRYPYPAYPRPSHFGTGTEVHISQGRWRFFLRPSSSINEPGIRCKARSRATLRICVGEGSLGLIGLTISQYQQLSRLLFGSGAALSRAPLLPRLLSAIQLLHAVHRPHSPSASTPLPAPLSVLCFAPPNHCASSTLTARRPLRRTITTIKWAGFVGGVRAHLGVVIVVVPRQVAGRTEAAPRRPPPASDSPSATRGPWPPLHAARPVLIVYCGQQRRFGAMERELSPLAPRPRLVLVLLLVLLPRPHSPSLFLIPLLNATGSVYLDVDVGADADAGIAVDFAVDPSPDDDYFIPSERLNVNTKMRSRDVATITGAIWRDSEDPGGSELRSAWSSSPNDQSSPTRRTPRKGLP
ncbi:hypothetical protein C8R45DRAFT_1209477 [Mycena sanguinolenta]|nr:hypothetical protein C8R45DRAFT_1209477 [Mycena sanguinolenta]